MTNTGSQGSDEGDLSGVAVSFGQEIVLTATTAFPASLSSAPWTGAGTTTFLGWDLDTRGDAEPDFRVALFNNGEGVLATVEDEDTITCEDVAISQPTSNSYQLVVDPACLDNPAGFSATALLYWDPTGTGAFPCTGCSLDHAPDDGYLPWVVPMPESAPGSLYEPVTTKRIFSGTVGTTPRPIQVVGTTVPDHATAVAVNVEVSKPTQKGYLRVTPFGQNPTVATQHFTAGRTISNLVVVKLVEGKIQAKLSAGSATVLLDVAGYYTNESGSQFTPMATTRIFSGTVGSTIAPVTAAGVHGVPTSATAVVVNVEVKNPTLNGYLRVTPFGSNPTVATQHFLAGRTISNLAVVQVVSNKIQVKLSAGSALVSIDIAGYYNAEVTGSRFTPVPTTRIDQLTGSTTPEPVSVAGVGGVPPEATAVAVNVEVKNPTHAGYLRVTPFLSNPTVASQHFVPGQTISALVIVKVVNGRIQAKLSAGTALLSMDVAGYYSEASFG